MLTEQDMRRLNQRIEVANEPVAQVAADALRSLGLTHRVGRQSRPGKDESTRGVVAYLWSQRETIAGLTLRHLLLVGVSLAGALVVALPLGLVLERSRRVAESVIRAVSLLQTLPSIALLAFMIPLLGIGVVPALVALFLYSLYPILRNTYTGVRDAAPDAVGAAWALGMTPRQVLRYVRLPLAAPVIMAGLRTAAVINVGTATLAAFIGAGGLGDPIAAGLALSDTRMILSGALPAAMLALLVDGVLGVCERLVAPRG
jgi:osmoprotectant transport system permease protein